MQTDMGNSGARSFGFEQAPDTLESSVAGVAKLVSKQKYSEFSATQEALIEMSSGRLTDPRENPILGSSPLLMAASFHGEIVH